MINRLDEDIVAHAENMKNKKFSSIRGLSKSDIESTLDTPSKLKDVITLVKSLMESLKAQKEMDEAKIATCLASTLGSIRENI